MGQKTWEFAEKINTNKTPYEYLFDYAKLLKNDTNNLIEGVVTENASSFSEEIFYSLYLVVPELSKYSYKLLEVTQSNPINNYPVKVKLFGKDPGANIEKQANSESEFNQILHELIKSEITKQILTQLNRHIKIKRAKQNEK